MTTWMECACLSFDKVQLFEKKDWSDASLRLSASPPLRLSASPPRLNLNALRPGSLIALCEEEDDSWCFPNRNDRFPPFSSSSSSSSRCHPHHPSPASLSLCMCLLAVPSGGQVTLQHSIWREGHGTSLVRALRFECHLAGDLGSSYHPPSLSAGFRLITWHQVAETKLWMQGRRWREGGGIGTYGIMPSMSK